MRFFRRRREPASATPPAPVVFEGTGIDHERKVIAGKVYLPRPLRCPHTLLVRDDGAEPWSSPCIGETGHLDRRHADQYGRIWT